MKLEWMPIIVSVGLFILNSLFVVIGFLIRQSINNFKNEVSGLRVDVTELTDKMSELVTNVSNVEIRINSDHDEILNLRKTSHDHANRIQKLEFTQNRCKTCNA